MTLDFTNFKCKSAINHTYYIYNKLNTLHSNKLQIVLIVASLYITRFQIVMFQLFYIKNVCSSSLWNKHFSDLSFTNFWCVFMVTCLYHLNAVKLQTAFEGNMNKNGKIWFGTMSELLVKNCSLWHITYQD